MKSLVAPLQSAAPGPPLPETGGGESWTQAILEQLEPDAVSKGTGRQAWSRTGPMEMANDHNSTRFTDSVIEKGDIDERSRHGERSYVRLGTQVGSPF